MFAMVASQWSSALPRLPNTIPSLADVVTYGALIILWSALLLIITVPALAAFFIRDVLVGDEEDGSEGGMSAARSGLRAGR